MSRKNRRLPARPVQGKPLAPPLPEAAPQEPPAVDTAPELSEAERLQKAEILFARFIQEIGGLGVGFQLFTSSRTLGHVTQIEPGYKFAVLRTQHQRKR